MSLETLVSLRPLRPLRPLCPLWLKSKYYKTGEVNLTTEDAEGLNVYRNLSLK